MRKLYASILTNKTNKQKRYLIDKHLDTSGNGSRIDNTTAAEIIDYYRSKSGDAFELVSACAMPNHVHVLLKQNASLPKIVQILKGGAAHIVNKNLS